MNTTISRIAASAPVAVALFSFSFGSAHAAPYEPGASEKVQIQPAGDPPEWDIDLPISDDLPDGDPPVDPPVDPDDVDPADPADEPEDEPSEDDGNDEESDEDAGDESNTSGNGGGSKGGSSKGAKETDTNGDSDEAAATPVEAADVQLTPASARGVQVPTEVVAAAGAVIAGIFGWATYRRMKVTATV